MFFIYDQNNQSIKEIKYRPFLEGLKANMNYYSATNIAANPERNVIVTTMYHMDLVHLYDFQGMHIPADTRSAFPVISVQSPVSIQCCWQS